MLHQANGGATAPSSGPGPFTFFHELRRVIDSAGVELVSTINDLLSRLGIDLEVVGLCFLRREVADRFGTETLRAVGHWPPRHYDTTLVSLRGREGTVGAMEVRSPQGPLPHEMVLALADELARSAEDVMLRSALVGLREERDLVIAREKLVAEVAQAVNRHEATARHLDLVIEAADLMPLGERSLRWSLRRLADVFATDTAVEVTNRTHGRIRTLPLRLRGALYGAALEGLLAACGPAQASTARIILSFGPDTVTVTVEDDGTFLALRSERAKEHYAKGEATMAAVGGTFDLRPMRPRGAVMTATVQDLG